MLPDNISLNTIESDINQLNEINSYDIDNNYHEVNDDVVFYSEDSLMVSNTNFKYQSFDNSSSNLLDVARYETYHNHPNPNLQVLTASLFFFFIKLK